MKSFDEFVNEKFDYRKQETKLNFQELKNKNAFFNLEIIDEKPVITSDVINNIKTHNYRRFPTFSYENKNNEKCTAMYINFPLALQHILSISSHGGNTYIHSQYNLISTHENYLKTFIDSKYYKEYLGLLSLINNDGYGNYLNEVNNLIKNFLQDNDILF